MLEEAHYGWAASHEIAARIFSLKHPVEKKTSKERKLWEKSKIERKFATSTQERFR